MKRFSHCMLCVLLATPAFAADGPAAAPQRRPNEQATKKADIELPQITLPVGEEKAPKQRPQNIPAAKKRAPREAVDDPFGASPAPSAKDPFGADPFGGPENTKPAPPKRPAPPRAAPTNRRAAVVTTPSLAVPATSAAIRCIEGQLDKETKFDYLDTPLKDVIDEVALRHDLPIIIDRGALEDFGIGTDAPITVMLNGVSLRSALRLTLRELDLTYAIRDEVLLITTPEAAESLLRSRFYLVSNLLPTDRDGSYLTKLITTHVAPDSWSELGGPGAISFVEHLETLAVTQSEDVHEEIDRLLASLARLADHQHQR